MDGARADRLAHRRASALAARYLARDDASHLVMVGAGALAPLPGPRPCGGAADRARRRLEPDARARELAGFALAAAPGVAVADDLEAAVREADIVSCATLSTEPLIAGAWLKTGAHLDLVGAFTLEMREADDEALRRARVFVDTAPR